MNNGLKEYKIVYVDYQDITNARDVITKLEKEVKKYIDDGYEVVGGATDYCGYYGWKCLMQTLVKL